MVCPYLVHGLGHELGHGLGQKPGSGERMKRKKKKPKLLISLHKVSKTRREIDNSVFHHHANASHCRTLKSTGLPLAPKNPLPCQIGISAMPNQHS